MKRLRIVGVPEHFNLPWHLAISSGAFDRAGIKVEWTNVLEGTGRMASMLREGETDLAVILTGGIVKDIVNGANSTILQTFVESPLVWGIHTGAGSSIASLKDLYAATPAISRYGSGSHLMSYMLAKREGLDPGQLSFELINTIDGAVKLLSKDDDHIFLWEKFMTKGYVDDGTFRHLGDIPSPWPSFVIAANRERLQRVNPEVKVVLNIINDITHDLFQIKGLAHIIARTYDIDVPDVEQWMSLTNYGKHQIKAETLQLIQDEIQEVNIIDKQLPPEAFVTNL